MVEIFQNAVTPEEINTLLEYYERDDGTTQHIVDPTSKHEFDSKTPLWTDTDWPRDVAEQIISRVLPEPAYCEFVFFSGSGGGFRIHVDTRKGEDQTGIYKQVLVPLEIDGEANTVFFDNHWNGPKTRFSRVDPVYPKSMCEHDRTLENISDYTNIVNYKPDTLFNPEIKAKYLPHVAIENLHGLTIDKIVPWQLGEVYTFDRTQLHSAGATHNYKKWLTLFTCYS